MALSIPERIAQVAEHIAAHDSHGYSQPNRSGDGTKETVTLSDGSKVTIHGGDYDCSEMVRVCVNCALSGKFTGPIEYMWTGSQDAELKAQGFTRMAFSASKVKRGDVLWVSGHTGVALGNGKQADAHGDEYGGISGPNRGDQTGSEVEVRTLRSSWTYIYRASGKSEDVYQFFASTFRAVATEEWNVRSSPEINPQNITGTLNPGDTIYCDGWLDWNGKHWYTYLANSGKRRWICSGDSFSGLVAT